MREGLTDGDLFSIPAEAVSDPDPVVQSWIAYSLSRSTCQLGMGGENPARNSSFDCELVARRLLVRKWARLRYRDPELADGYLDSLHGVAVAGFLGEYVWHYHGRESWERPVDLSMKAFGRWRDENLPGHRPQTRIVGSWQFGQG